MSKKNKNQKASQASTSTSRREALRKQREAEAHRQRTQRIVVVAAVVIAVVIVAIVVVALVQNHATNQRQNQSGTGEQIIPAMANADNSTMRYPGNTDDDSLPVVIGYSDFQCPGCASFGNDYMDPMLRQLADEGKITLEYMQINGLDRGIPGDNSFRANIAWTCASEAGYQTEYMNAVYDNQPRQGIGWTDEELTETWAEQAGLAGEDLAQFQQCFAEGSTTGFVTEMQSALPSNVKATPSYTVNGELVDIPQQGFTDIDDLYDTLMSYA